MSYKSPVNSCHCDIADSNLRIRSEPLTIRQRLAQLLSEDEYTLRELSDILGLRIKELCDHMTHVQRSMGKDVTIYAQPPKCLNCDFVFKDRKRFTTPGRCPLCKSEKIEHPLFRIRKKGSEK